MEQIKTKDLPELDLPTGTTYIVVDDGETKKLKAFDLLDYNYLKNKPTLNGETIRDDMTVKLYAHRLSVRDDDGNYYYFTVLSATNTVITKEELLNRVKGGYALALANCDLTIEDSDDNFFHYTLHQVAYASNSAIRLDIVQGYTNRADIWQKEVYVLNVSDTVYIVK